jgi:hypothetical protein
VTSHEPHAAGPTGPGSVILDIGQGAGALVLYAPAFMLGAEIEVGPADQAALRTHSQVRQRLSGQQPAGSATEDVSYAAVYPGLAAGRYVVWRDADDAAGAVTIADGQVTTWHWPEGLS